MLTPNKLEGLPFKTITYYEELQEWVIKQIAERIGRTTKISSLTEYQIKRLEEIGLFNKDLKNKIVEISGLSENEVNKIFKEAGKTNLLADKNILTESGVGYVPFAKNPEMLRITELYATQTQDSLKNLTRTMGFKSSEKMFNKLMSVEDYFVGTMDKQFNAVFSGLVSYDDAIKNVVEDMTSSGLRTIDYESGYSNQVDVAVRRAILGGIKDMTNLQAEYNADLVNTTCFEITWHAGHRPSHLWGGRRFDTSGRKYPTEMELYAQYNDTLTGEVGTLDDYNCYHEKFAVFPDSKPIYTDERLKELEDGELKEKEFEGKKYNAYQARQKQRQLERTMRKIRLEAVGFKEAGNTKAYKIKRARYSVLRSKYQGFSDKMGLKTEYQRVYYDRLGRI